MIASGSNRVDKIKIAGLVGEKITRAADAEFVRHHTGYAIGGVPPVEHSGLITTFIDEDFLVFDEIWATAGTLNAVFRLTGDDLIQATGGQVVRVIRTEKWVFESEFPLFLNTPTP